MKDSYYAKMPLGENEYCNLVCIRDANSYAMTKESKCWQFSQGAYDAPWDTCYDYLSDDDAEKLALSWGVDREDFEDFPEIDNRPYEIAIEIGFVPECSKKIWDIPYFDSGLALENAQYCGTIMSDQLHVINSKLHDRYDIDCYSSCWRGSKKELEDVVKELHLEMACVDRLEGNEQYGLLIFEHKWKR